MSESFCVKSQKSISYGGFLQVVALPEFMGLAPPPSDRDAPLTGIRRFYQEEISCRGIEIARDREGTEYAVSANHPSSLDDWMLMIHTIGALSRYFGVNIEADGESLPESAFNDKYGPDWAQRMVQFGAKSTLGTARGLTGGQFAQIDCAIRLFYLGKRTADEIMAGRSEEEAATELSNRMRLTQYVSLDYFVPKEYKLNANNRKFVVFGEGLQMLVPLVQFVALPTENTNIVYIPFDVFPSLVGERLSWLDEKQALVRPVRKEDWPQLIEAANKHAVDLLPQLKEGGVTGIVTKARDRYDRLMADTREDE